VIAALLLPALLGFPGDIDALAKQLKDPAEKTRRAAVQDLVREHSPAAWALVLAALADPSAMVADEAQLALADVEDPALRRELAGKHGLEAGDALLQRRAAEVFGRMQAPVDGAALLHALADKDTELRRLAAWSLERAARRNAIEPKAAKSAIPALTEAFKHDKEALVRAAALRALSALKPLDEQELGRDPAPECVCARLQCAVEQHGAAALPQLAEMRTASQLPVRCEVVLQLAALRSRPALELLVSMLADEHDARLAWTIASELTTLSGVRNERNVAAWKDWLARQPESWSPAPVRTGAAIPAAAGPETTTCVFVGMPVLSDHLALLIDLSGSISKPRADGKTRKEALDVELERTLHAFGKDVRFNLIPYTKQPLPWEKRLVEATSANVEKAVAWFRGLRDTGKGNVGAAFELAFSDPEIDTLLLFSDGAPTGGEHWNLELIAELFAERNRFRHLVLDAVIVDAKKPIAEHWRTICEQSGGRMLPVDMK